MFAMTGAGGKLGQKVADALVKRAGGSGVKLGTRSPDKLDALAARGAQVVKADFDDYASLNALFSDTKVALVISGNAPNDPRIKQHEATFKAAVAAGVQRIVYTSFANPTTASRFSIARSHAESEAILKGLGVAYTILRNNLYAENILIEAARTSGVLAQPGAEGKVAFITQADIAEATAGAMVGSGHDNKTYEVTGPEALNQVEIAAVLSEAWGRPIQAVEITAAEYAERLKPAGLPPFVVELIVTIRAAVAAGEYAKVNGDAAKLAGRAIEPVSAFLKRQ